MEEHVLAAVYPMLLLPPQLSRRVSGTAHGFLQRHRSLPPSAPSQQQQPAHLQSHEYAMGTRGNDLVALFRASPISYDPSGLPPLLSD